MNLTERIVTTILLGFMLAFVWAIGYLLFYEIQNRSEKNRLQNYACDGRSPDWRQRQSNC